MEQIRWIFEKAADENEWYAVKKSFFADTTDGVFIDISALGRYVLYINGNLIARGPSKSFDFCKLYDSIDISSAVKSGRNEITVLSQKIENGGIYAKVYTEDKVICITDESWKIKKYEALRSDTVTICPPLEPIRQNEEWYDANKDSDLLSYDYDYSLWERASYIDLKESYIEKSYDGLQTATVVMPQSILALNTFKNKIGYGIRVTSDCRTINNATKSSYELYVCEVFAKESFLADIIGPDRMWLNGRQIESEISFEAGENLFVIYYEGTADPEFFINTEAQLVFSQWYVYNLDSTEDHHPWSYAEDIFKGTQTPERIEKVSTAQRFSQLDADFLKNAKPASETDISVGLSLKKRIFGEFNGSFSDLSLKRSALYKDNSVTVKDIRFMMNQNINYMTALGNISFVLDFGVEQLGYIKFKLYAGEGTVIDIAAFELIDYNGIRHIDQNCMRYICRDGWQEFTAFLPRGFRYIDFNISESKSPVKIEYICVEDATASILNCGYFECNDTVLNEIYNMSINTARACMSDTYVDCPAYEQVYWVGDAIVPAHVNLTNFGAYAYDFKCLNLIGKTITESFRNFYREKDENYLNNKYLVLPTYGTYVKSGIPEWSFMWPLAVYNYYLYSGDREGTGTLFQYVKQMLSNCENMMSERYLFSCDGGWNLLDWAANDLLMCGEVTASSAWLSKIYQLFSEIAEDFGDAVLAKEYILRAEKIKQAINAYCWNDEAKGYVDTVRDREGYEIYLSYFNKKKIDTVSYDIFKNYERISEQTNTICYLCDCVPEDRERYVQDIITRIEDENYEHISSSPDRNSTNVNNGIYHNINDIIAVGTPYFMYYTFGALLKMKHIDKMLEVMTRDYKGMLNVGTKTCWESFYEGNTKDLPRSICHGWGASPAVYLITDICGIKPIKPGFEEFIFKPEMSYLDSIKARIPTPYGMIFIDIDRKSGKREISYPKKCKMTEID